MTCANICLGTDENNFMCSSQQQPLTQTCDLTAHVTFMHPDAALFQAPTPCLCVKYFPHSYAQATGPLLAFRFAVRQILSSFLSSST